MTAVSLDAYRRYLSARGYAHGYRWQRMAIARDWMAWTGGDLAGATFHDVERWATGRNVSAGTTRNYHVALRGFYRWLRREGVVSHDPTELVDRPPTPRRLPRPAPEREIARLVARADVQLRAMLALMACGGLRCVECSRLDWCDVDLSAASVIVCGKGSRERLVSISGDVVTALAALALATAGRPAGPVFVGPTGRRLSPARVSQRVARLAAARGSTVRAHQLRHRCATMALQQPGADLLAVRDLLGHASVSTTEGYTAVLPERTAAVSRALRLPAA